ncbi:MAG: hypothetical protein H0X46_09780, partial [Bacteroidetes bacterium]|nr:hypothetical protein [Bacteroidota bacterium]
MKTLFTSFFLFFSLMAFPQNDSTAKSQFYYPDGKKYNGNAETIRQLNNELTKNGLVHIHLYEYKDEFTLVGFKLFTAEPLWVETTYPQSIDSAIRSFDIENYYKYQLETDLYGKVEEPIISSDYFLETLGKPDTINSNPEKNEAIWKYNKLKLKIKFSNKIMIAYRSEYDSEFKDKEYIKRVREELKLHKGRHYYNTENYCNFFLKDTNSTIRYCAQWFSNFEVLSLQGNFAYVRFNQVATDHTPPADTVKIEHRFGEDIYTPYIVNTEDTFAVNIEDFDRSGYSQQLNEKSSDYIIKGKMLDEKGQALTSKSFILTIDENYGRADTLYLKTNRDGTYEYGGNTTYGFICTMGIRNKKAYHKDHQY